MQNLLIAEQNFSTKGLERISNIILPTKFKGYIEKEK
jgi:hypothetical protein